MTAVFRSCLPRFYSNTDQSISSEHLSNKTTSIISLNDEQLDENSMDSSSIINNQNTVKSTITTTTMIPQLDSSSHIEQNQCNQTNLLSSPKQTNTSRLKPNHNKIIKKRGPCYSRINEKSQPLLTRLVGTIFGDQTQILSNKKQRSKRPSRTSKKSILLPSKSTIKKQFDENEQTLRSLVTLLTQMESNVKLPAITSDDNHEKIQDRNNNRIDDTYI